MSLLDEALSSNRRVVEDQIRKRVKEGTQTVNKIFDTATFIKVAEDVCKINVLQPDEIEQCSGNRTRTRLYQTPISSLMPSSDPKEPRGVTKKAWAGIIKAAIEGHIAQIKLSGFNGSWHMMAYQVDVVNDARLNAASPTFVLVCKYVDIHGQQDLVFRNGRPQMDQIAGNAGISKEDLATLLGALQEGADDRMQKLLAPIVEMLASANAAEAEEIATPEAEPEEAPKPPARRRRRAPTKKDA